MPFLNIFLFLIQFLSVSGLVIEQAKMSVSDGLEKSLFMGWKLIWKWETWSGKFGLLQSVLNDGNFRKLCNGFLFFLFLSDFSLFRIKNHKNSIKKSIVPQSPTFLLPALYNLRNSPTNKRFPFHFPFSTNWSILHPNSILNIDNKKFNRKTWKKFKIHQKN